MSVSDLTLWTKGLFARALMGPQAFDPLPLTYTLNKPTVSNYVDALALCEADGDTDAIIGAAYHFATFQDFRMLAAALKMLLPSSGFNESQCANYAKVVLRAVQCIAAAAPAPVAVPYTPLADACKTTLKSAANALERWCQRNRHVEAASSLKRTLADIASRCTTSTRPEIVRLCLLALATGWSAPGTYEGILSLLRIANTDAASRSIAFRYISRQYKDPATRISDKLLAELATDGCLMEILERVDINPTGFCQRLMICAVQTAARAAALTVADAFEATALKEQVRADAFEAAALKEQVRADAFEATALAEKTRADVFEATALKEQVRADAFEATALAEKRRADVFEATGALMRKNLLVLSSMIDSVAF